MPQYKEGKEETVQIAGNNAICLCEEDKQSKLKTTQ